MVQSSDVQTNAAIDLSHVHIRINVRSKKKQLFDT